MIRWNETKRRKVIKDHSVDFKNLDDVFDDPYAVYAEDHEHSLTEARWLVIAKSSHYGIVAVSYTFRGDDIHLITARRAERWLIRFYEKQRNRF